MKKDMLTVILFLKRKENKKNKKKIDSKFIRTNPNKENHDVFCEIGRI